MTPHMTLVRAEREARKLARISQWEMAYTIFLVVGILACVGLIGIVSAWMVFIIFIALWVPKFWLYGKWKAQLQVVAHLSPEARHHARLHGYDV